MDDVIIKSKDSGLIPNLEETFDTLRRNNMRLNPMKCMLGVRSKKFLGFILNEKCI